jgi:hypothetical protein
MNTLERDRLDGLIETLQLAKKFGFSSLSSPIEPLFEAAIDMFILLSTLLKEGSPSLQRNPEIKFLDVPDALGNPKSVKIHKVLPDFQDQEASEYLMKLASLMVALKRRLSLPKALKASGLAVDRPTQTQNNSEKAIQNKSGVPNSKRKNSAYYRRQRKIKNRP